MAGRVRLAAGAVCEVRLWEGEVSNELGVMLSQRGERYGPFAGHADITQTLKRCVHGHAGGAGWGRMSAAQREAMDMILHKIGRIVNGDPDYDDSWRDIAGYAERVVEAIRDAQQARAGTGAK